MGARNRTPATAIGTSHDIASRSVVRLRLRSGSLQESTVSQAQRACRCAGLPLTCIDIVATGNVMLAWKGRAVGKPSTALHTRSKRSGLPSATMQGADEHAEIKAKQPPLATASKGGETSVCGRLMALGLQASRGGLRSPSRAQAYCFSLGNLSELRDQ